MADGTRAPPAGTTKSHILSYHNQILNARIYFADIICNKLLIKKKVCLRWFQEKYRRDQEKLEEEWRRAQQEVYGEENSGPEVRGLS